MEEKETNHLAHYGSIAGSVMAIFALIGFLGKPHLVEFIDNEIELYDEKKKEENSSKVKLRKLLSEKMELDEDEVHIEIGKFYKDYTHNEEAYHDKVDSLAKEIKLNYFEIGENIKAIKKLEADNKHFRKQLDKHGLFH
jgi:hypothetical protein